VIGQSVALLRRTSLNSAAFVPNVTAAIHGLGFFKDRPMTRSPDSPITYARRFLVRGRVQGVGFRWFVESEARLLGVAGWVRNNSDGAVEVYAQGTREQLSTLYGRLQKGPRAARVDQVEASDANLTKDLTTFRIEGAW